MQPHPGSLEQVLLAATANHRALLAAFARVTRWHLTTQDQLFAQLRTLWPDDRARTMVDLGCHAGHGHHKNISDAMLWLHYFNHSGTVLGIDALEDFALDLQHRFDDTPPYADIKSVRKRTLAAAVGTQGSAERDDAIDLFWLVAKVNIGCCAGTWCGWSVESRNADHHCRITRQRLGRSPSTLPTPPSSYPASLFNAIATGSFNRSVWPRYWVPVR